ncbi:uncharacterized protein LOC135101863 [Scylla paramamosain]|uniref:uncharacterized protein LOC135101863 n=1 Tax=Scylla paramamosain TaxID=85552 RepID=UPI003082D200
MHQTSATVHPADPSQFIIKDSTFQVVSYSYLAAPQGQSHSKDVVYGSGAAAKPPSSGHSFSARSPTLGQTLSLEIQKSGHTAAPGHTAGSSDHIHLSTTPPVITAFESSKLSHISPSPLVHSSSFSAPSPFFSSSFSPSAHSSSPPQPSLPPASLFTHPEAIFAMHQTSATVHPADPSQFIIKDSTFQEALECNSHRWQGNTAYLPSHNSNALNELGRDN